MARKTKQYKQLKHQVYRTKTEMWKHSPKYKKRRKNRLMLRRNEFIARKAVEEKTEINKISPSNFSFVDNTDAVISYLNECKQLLHNREKVVIDIGNVENMSPDAIALLAACANDSIFLGKYGKISGNAPKNAKLNKLFVESGFYKFVNSSTLMKSAQKKDINLFHKESHYKVQPEIAKQACLFGTKHVFSSELPIPELYEMIIEAMSNTNNHANKKNAGATKWWLYTYNDPRGTTCYSFVDLGVGIFDSLPVGFYKKTVKKFGLSHNIDLVQDLLDGKIKSREKVDNNIRGKGIPQIANNSQIGFFGRALIISNDVKIDLIQKSAEKLNANFQGTFLYWELRQTV